MDELTFRALLAAAPDAIVIVNLAGRIVVANTLAEQLFGYDQATLLGMLVDDLLPDTVRARHAGLRAQYARSPHTRPMGSGLQLVARRKDGSMLPVEVSLSATHTNDDLLVTAVIRDSTAHRQTTDALAARLNAAEAAVLQAARLAAIGQLSAAIAHEIANPLFAARNCLDLLEQSLASGLHDQTFLTIAREELGRIAIIIERMREFYRPTVGQRSAVDLRLVLDRTLTLVVLRARQQAIEIVMVIDPALPTVYGDADQLRQVFLNVMINAVEAMPDSGTLTVRAAAGSSTVVVEISDTGYGIPADIRAQLFEPFFTSKPNGTGLGLSISAYIVTQHGGQIDVESTIGVGTTFRVILPREAVPEALRATQAPPAVQQ